MNTADKEQFIRTMCTSICDELANKARSMPAEWDGHELRQLLADKFLRETTSTMADKRTKRFKAYLNEVIIRNL